MLAVLWMQHAEEYKASARQVFRAAEEHLDESLKPGSAELSQIAVPQGPWTTKDTAIVFDLDETLLDNSDYQAGYVQHHAGFNEVTWDRWVGKSAAREVPGAADFVKKASEKVDKIFYVSNRACRNPIDNVSDASTIEKLCPQLTHTMKVMNDHKFPYAGDREAFYLAGMSSGLKSKKEIREKIGKDFRIVMLVGDNLRDFIDRTDYQKNKEKLEKLWGHRWFLLPNPAYGSWPDEFLAEDDKKAIKDACGDRPKGPDNWEKTGAWDDCAYPFQQRAREAALRSWDDS
jgi:acid phosphatase